MSFNTVAKAKLKAHASKRPPSAAARWLSCPASVEVQQLYDNDESDASLKGDGAHDALELGIVFGTPPDSADVDVDLAVIGVLEWVKARREEHGPKCQLFAEQRYDIPETGEFGTSDITFVTPKMIEIVDYKNGFVPVEIYLNAQMMTYLLGAIAKYGERPEYKITVLQPFYDHRDGPYRTQVITPDDVAWFRQEVLSSMKAEPDDFRAGKHCKKTYCPHRGNCLTFQSWARTNARDAFFPSDVHALDDTQLAQALDHAETLAGLRDELRKEAMRRIMNQDRTIHGHKIVRSRADRSFVSDTAREEAFNVAKQLGATDDDLYSKKYESVAGIERFVKEKCKHFGPGKWQLMWEQQFKEYVRDFSGSLTLARDTDGRPAHARGVEFGSIATAQPTSVPTVI